MNAAVIPAALADRLGPEATLGLTQTLDVAQRECLDMTLTTAADRFERRLIEETSKLRVEMHEGFASLRNEMATQKVDTLRWSFLFWIGQVAALAAIVSMLLR